MAKYRLRSSNSTAYTLQRDKLRTTRLILSLCSRQILEGGSGHFFYRQEPVSDSDLSIHTNPSTSTTYDACAQ